MLGGADSLPDIVPPLEPSTSMVKIHKQHRQARQWPANAQHISRQSSKCKDQKPHPLLIQIHGETLYDLVMGKNPKLLPNL